MSIGILLSRAILNDHFIGSSLFGRHVRGLHYRFNKVNMLLSGEGPHLRVSDYLLFELGLNERPFSLLNGLLLLNLMFLERRIRIMLHSTAVQPILVRLHGLTIGLHPTFLNSYGLYTLPFNINNGLLVTNFRRPVRGLLFVRLHLSQRVLCSKGGMNMRMIVTSVIY